MKRGIEGGLRKYESKNFDDWLSLTEGTLEEAADVIKKLQSGEYITRDFQPTPVQEMEN